MLSLPALCRSAHESIMSQGKIVMAKAAKRNTLSEQRKPRLSRALKRDQLKAIHWLMEEDGKNDNDFEPEKEADSTIGESDHVLPGPAFVRPRDGKSRIDEDDLQNVAIRLSMGVKAMNMGEMAA
jgi:hypothetical protein